jgi:hypothetical protein
MDYDFARTGMLKAREANPFFANCRGPFLLLRARTCPKTVDGSDGQANLPRFMPESKVRAVLGTRQCFGLTRINAYIFVTG